MYEKIEAWLGKDIGLRSHKKLLAELGKNPCFMTPSLLSDSVQHFVSNQYWVPCPGPFALKELTMVALFQLTSYPRGQEILRIHLPTTLPTLPPQTPHDTHTFQQDSYYQGPLKFPDK